MMLPILGKYPVISPILQVLAERKIAMVEWLFIPVAYLVGSISSAILVCRILGLPDPREQGSGNPGATNVLRIGGKKAAGITLFGDLLKGVVPVYAARLLDVPVEIQALTGLAAFFGHLYPVFFKFKGGKGVATSVGVMLGLSWPYGLAVMATWTLVYKVGKISSVAALTVSVLSPIYAWLIVGEMPVAVAACVMSAVLLWRHKSNIQRLLAGEEK